MATAQREIEVELAGKRYHGFYRVQGGWINVVSGAYSRTASVGALMPSLVARRLLKEMIREGRAQPSE